MGRGYDTVQEPRKSGTVGTIGPEDEFNALAVLNPFTNYVIGSEKGQRESRIHDHTAVVVRLGILPARKTGRYLLLAEKPLKLFE